MRPGAPPRRLRAGAVRRRPRHRGLGPTGPPARRPSPRAPLRPGGPRPGPAHPRAANAPSLHERPRSRRTPCVSASRAATIRPPWFTLSSCRLPWSCTSLRRWRCRLLSDSVFGRVGTSPAVGPARGPSRPGHGTGPAGKGGAGSPSRLRAWVPAQPRWCEVHRSGPPHAPTGPCEGGPSASPATCQRPSTPRAIVRLRPAVPPGFPGGRRRRASGTSALGCWTPAGDGWDSVAALERVLGNDSRWVASGRWDPRRPGGCEQLLVRRAIVSADELE